MSGELQVTVHHEDDDDGSLWAEVAELPGCFASGDTLPELWDNLQEAVGLYLSDSERTVTVEMRTPQATPVTERVETRELVCS